jgi:hypothetical protein
MMLARAISSATPPTIVATVVVRNRPPGSRTSRETPSRPPARPVACTAAVASAKVMIA